MSNAADRLFAFVLANAEHEPASRRAGLYRDAAEILARPEYASPLMKLARDLDDIEARHTQLLFDFRHKHGLRPNVRS